ncbi:hydroxymethylglutaryl-CoA lyase [Macrococcus equipercicus]|uniref:Hydroxymethylglutaryl-CoA lyase n=1 Tax=Macrococcus equipercicus TaxID=69967 RepID=A0ABQ6RAA6_9STAP|nr:hydroxymethylglutaryl-CoA lyase [Macrococcus equipercicus]KAA1040263.1 hydroxymethylglutaryl-CoA lyase [Macrococcus equipercicus]
MLPAQVVIKEVGPRDGLQNETQTVPLEVKLKLIGMLEASGLSYIEATSFVHPKWMPQLSDADELLQRLTGHARFSALVPNIKGMARAEATRLQEIAVFISASEVHNSKNLNKSTAEALDDIKQVTERSNGRYQIRAYISMVFGSPFGDDVSLGTVKELMAALYELGVYEISLGDTTGVANPQQVDAVLSELLKSFPREKIAMHFHDTNGLALANIYASLQHGIAVFDASVGGLGGCPYAEGASGNVATEDVVYMMNELNIATGINMEQLLMTADYISRALNFTNLSSQLRKYRGERDGTYRN